MGNLSLDMRMLKRMLRETCCELRGAKGNTGRDLNSQQSLFGHLTAYHVT